MNVQAEATCPNLKISIGGTLSTKAAIREKTRTEASEAVSIFVPAEASKVVQGLRLEFARTGNSEWTVLSTAQRASTDPDTDTGYPFTIAILSFAERWSEANQVSAFIPVDESGVRQIKVDFNFDDLAMSDDEDRIAYRVVETNSLPCEPFGRPVSDLGKTPLAQMRIFSGSGEDITDKVSVNNGGFPTLKAGASLD
jgi:hypothetical protein